MNLLDLKALSAAHAAMHLAEMVLDERVKMLERVFSFQGEDGPARRGKDGR